MIASFRAAPRAARFPIHVREIMNRKFRKDSSLDRIALEVHEDDGQDPATSFEETNPQQPAASKATAAKSPTRSVCSFRRNV
jgi:hypothetical protein